MVGMGAITQAMFNHGGASRSHHSQKSLSRGVVD